MLSRRDLLISGAAAVASAPFVARAASIPVLGLTLPLTGVQSEIALDMLDGYRLAAASMDDSFSIEVLDDASDPARTTENIRKLGASAGVLAASGIVGTPHAQAALPVATASGLPVVGIRSGAASLRGGEAGVFHFRSSYEAELDRLAQILAGSGSKNVEVIFSDDSFGKGSVKTLRASLDRLGVKMAEPISVNRNGENLAASVERLAERARAAKEYTAIVLLVIAGPMIDATRLLREKHKIVAPVYAMSHVANRRLAMENLPSFSGLGVMLAFPLPRVSKEAIAYKYRSIAIASKKPELVESLAAYEGFFYGTVFGAAFREIGTGGTRKELSQALRKGFSVGGVQVAMNSKNEGYSFVDVAYKNSLTGKFHT